MTLTVGGLFSGAGGLDLGLERAGMTVRWQVENDPYCRRELAKHWPDVPCYGDIKTVDFSEVEPVDVICGGFPCQPVSVAGRRRAQKDERWLWPYMARAVRLVRPRFVLVENVPGLLTAGIGDVLGDLAVLGYDAEWSVVSACSVGAPHLRRRLFILAYPNGTGLEGRRRDDERPREQSAWQGVPKAFWLQPPADVRPVADGLPRRLAIRAAGNAVVPQVAQWVGRRIMEAAA